MTRKNDVLDKVFVNKSKQKKNNTLFNKAMKEKWSYVKFKKEVLKTKRKK